MILVCIYMYKVQCIINKSSINRATKVSHLHLTKEKYHHWSFFHRVQDNHAYEIQLLQDDFCSMYHKCRIYPIPKSAELLAGYISNALVCDYMLHIDK